MPYDAELAQRVRTHLRGRRGLSEKKMFGGVCFLLNGNIAVGIWHSSLIARVGPKMYAQLQREPWVGEFDITGRPMTGWLLISPEGLEEEAELGEWLERAWKFVKTLPEKQPGSGKKKPINQPRKPRGG